LKQKELLIMRSTQDIHTDHHGAALSHQQHQSETRAAHHRHEIHQTELQMLANTREFATHCDAWDIDYRHIEGLETAVFPIHGHTDTANHYFLAAVGSMITAIIFAIWFSSVSFVVENTLWLYGLAVVISVLVGVGASLLVRALFDAHSLNPAAVRKLNITLVISGTAFAILLTLFLWTRFNPESWLADHIAILMTGIEVSALIFSGTCDTAYRVYRWSARLHRKHRHHLDHLAAQEHALADEYAKLHDLENKINHHAGATHADPSASEHSHDNGSPGHAESHHARTHPRHSEDNHHEHKPIPATV
jgi:hypothetical protein